MNIALIFAGGVGKRMNTKALPKQFLDINGKPIIIHTIDFFQNHPDIDAICIVTVKDWIPYMKSLVRKFHITKAKWIVQGGKTALDSQYNGLKEINKSYKDCIVLIHDGVRPLITFDLISECIDSVKKFGSGITVVPSNETIVTHDNELSIVNTFDRSKLFIARAPQSFNLKDIFSVHRSSIKEKKRYYIDSASMMIDYGYSLHAVLGPNENIKITTPIDYYIYRALLQAKEDSQLYGI